jgi:phage gp45-like
MWRERWPDAVTAIEASAELMIEATRVAVSALVMADGAEEWNGGSDVEGGANTSGRQCWW